MEPLQKIIVQDELTEENLAKCRNVIYSLIKMESKGDPLPVPMQTTANNKAKTLKKDEQYKVRRLCLFSNVEFWYSNSNPHFLYY